MKKLISIIRRWFRNVFHKEEELCAGYTQANRRVVIIDDVEADYGAGMRNAYKAKGRKKRRPSREIHMVFMKALARMLLDVNVGDAIRGVEIAKTIVKYGGRADDVYLLSRKGYIVQLEAGEYAITENGKDAADRYWKISRGVLTEDAEIEVEIDREYGKQRPEKEIYADMIRMLVSMYRVARGTSKILNSYDMHDIMGNIGCSYSDIYKARKEGCIERVARGRYRITAKGAEIAEREMKAADGIRDIKRREEAEDHANIPEAPTEPLKPVAKSKAKPPTGKIRDNYANYDKVIKTLKERGPQTHTYSDIISIGSRHGLPNHCIVSLVRRGYLNAILTANGTRTYTYTGKEEPYSYTRKRRNMEAAALYAKVVKDMKKMGRLSYRASEIESILAKYGGIREDIGAMRIRGIIKRSGDGAYMVAK